MWQMLIGPAMKAGGAYLTGRRAQKAIGAATNIQAGQAQENADLSRDLGYRYNPYLQQSAEQWSQNVRDQNAASGAHLEDTAGQAGAGLRRTAADAGTGVRGAVQQGQGYLNPYLTQGQGANTALNDWAMQKLNGPAAEFEFSENDPSYQWRLRQGQKALERSAAARGTLRSGGTLKGMTDYAQGAASQEYGAEHARWLAEQTLANETQGMGAETLGGLANRGLAAGTQMGNWGLTGEKYAGDWATEAERQAGDWGVRAAQQAGGWTNEGARYQSDTMQHSLDQQLGRIDAGERAGMGYMTDRAQALAAGQIGQANAWNQQIQGMIDPFASAASAWGMGQQGGGGGGWPNQGRIPGLPPEYSIPGSPRVPEPWDSIPRRQQNSYWNW
jgi:hypothetical protein